MLDPSHVLAAARYIELNPVRARLAAVPEAWPWSSAGSHVDGRDDGLTTAAPLLDAVGDWRAFLAGGLKERDAEDLRRHERTGRPLGDGRFLAELETKLGRRLQPAKRGRKRTGTEEVNFVRCCLIASIPFCKHLVLAGIMVVYGVDGGLWELP